MADAGTTVIPSGATLSITAQHLPRQRPHAPDQLRRHRHDGGGRPAPHESEPQASRTPAPSTPTATKPTAPGSTATTAASASSSTTPAPSRGTAPAPSCVNVPFDNDGTVEVDTGLLNAASYSQSAERQAPPPHRRADSRDRLYSAQRERRGDASRERFGSRPRADSSRPWARASGYLNANPRTGTFSSLEGAGIGGGLAYTVQYDDTGATLVVGRHSIPAGVDRRRLGHRGRLRPSERELHRHALGALPMTTSRSLSRPATEALPPAPTTRLKAARSPFPPAS